MRPNDETALSDVAPARGSPYRVAVWVAHLALPLVGLWLLLARPAFDVSWTNHLWHFILVVAAAAASAGIAWQVRADARRNRDARLTLIAFGFLAAASFLLLHGLATPQVILAGSNSGFSLTVPVGLVVAGGFVLWSSFELSPQAGSAVQRIEPVLLAGLIAALIGWAVISLAGLAPGSANQQAWLTAMMAVGAPLYVIAMVRYWQWYRRRPGVVLLSLITAFALLAEALVAVAGSRSWHASWWLWHLLMLAAFAFVAYSAHVEYRREGSARGLFAGASLDATIRNLREEHRRALEELVDTLRGQRATVDGESDVRAITSRLGARFRLTDNQVSVLEGAAEATLEVDDLRRQLDTLFHQYISPDVAESLLEDPDRSRLGGHTLEVTCLFADLRGFTSFSEGASPDEVVAMLNRYFAAVVPVILRHGGTVVQFMGDAVMALFNAPKSLADHEQLAARTALVMQEVLADITDGGDDWPRFRIGVNTGAALIGNIGGQVRSFTAIGDAINLAARLEGLADPGQVVIGPQTYAAVSQKAIVEDLGAVTVKGKAEPVEAYVLHSLQP